MRAATSRLLLLGVSTAFALALAELVVRVFDLGPRVEALASESYRLSGNPRLGYELAPHASDGEGEISAAGLRDRDYPLAKPAGTRRIAVLGDSIAYGLRLRREQSFPEQLERLLGRHFAGPGAAFEVLNFGVPGYGLAQVVETLRARALPFAPDLVLYAYCLNDPQPYSLELENLLAHTPSAARDYRAALAREGARAAAHSRLYLLARYGLRSLTREGRAYGEAALWHRDDPQFVALEQGRHARYYAELHRAEASWGPAQAQLDALAELSRSSGVPVLVLVFPLLVELDRYPLAPLHVQLRAALAARSLGWMDLLPLFREVARRDPDLARDPLHPTARGHRLVALAALYRLLDEGWVEGRSASDFEALATELKVDPRWLPALREAGVGPRARSAR
jgi:lysophospholipase L1-like esterase